MSTARIRTETTDFSLFSNGGCTLCGGVYVVRTKRGRHAEWHRSQGDPVLSLDDNHVVRRTVTESTTFTEPAPIRQISCGCCTNGCTCHNHMDIPRGIRPQFCAAHSKTGAIEYKRA